VSETIEYEQFENSDGGNGAAVHAGEQDLQRLSEIPMELSVEIGRTHTTVGHTLQLRPGTIVELERDAGAPADLLINGTPIARGEVVVVDERYGLRITEILDSQHSPGDDQPAGAGTDDGEDAGETQLAEA